ncbi:MAG: sugar phosphate isomerase/epimerase family protein [Armatimonadota bacterium]|nr:sugar phosphate isomerase/epimerase family protein [Armatimonadota bacterium]
MQLGVTVAYARVHYSDEPTLEQYQAFARWAAERKFGGIELAAFSLEHFRRDFADLRAVRALRSLCQDLGVTVNAFEAGFLRHMTVSEEATVRQQALDGLRRSLEVARELGTDLVYLHSAPHPSWAIEFRRLYDDFTPPARVEVPPAFDWKAAWQQYVATIGEMARLAEQATARLALEIRPYEMVSNADGMRRLIEAVESPALGVVFDTAHFFVQKEILPVAVQKLADRIYLVHLADNNGIEDFHWAPGKGGVPWEGVLQALGKIAYQGFANIDVAGTYADIDAEICQGRDFVLQRWPGS